jgi:hypothetical protein
MTKPFLVECSIADFELDIAQGRMTHAMPVYEAMKGRGIGYYVYPAPLYMRPKAGMGHFPRRGSVVVIADDWDVYPAPGPFGFKPWALKRLARESDSRFVLLSGLGTQLTGYYSVAADDAKAGKLAVVVETCTAHLADWMEIIGEMSSNGSMIVTIAEETIAPARSLDEVRH